MRRSKKESSAAQRAAKESKKEFAPSTNPAQLSRPRDPEIPKEASWADLVARIRGGDPSGMEDLYQIFSKRVRYFLYQQLGPRDLDDKVHDVFVIAAQAIRNGDLREPERLMGYVRTVVRHQVSAYIADAVQARLGRTGPDGILSLSDHNPDPESGAIKRQNRELAMRVLDSIGKRDREILIRFYLKEQTPEEICRAMHLTETQFRLIKSRAKARFGELGKTAVSGATSPGPNRGSK
jgi:RNA polymerase sigma-70 factor, ECF subfamily